MFPERIATVDGRNPAPPWKVKTLLKKKKWDVYHVSTGAGFLNLQNSMWVEYGETTAVNQWDVQTFPGQKCEIH